MKIWIIVPLSRPANVSAIVVNVIRQRCAHDLRLAVVENGAAIGACARAGLVPDLLLTSEAHQSSAKNTALAAIRERGGGFWTTFDDDDWYGAGHVAELADNAHRAEAIGRDIHFVRLADGLHLFRGDHQPGYCKFITGPTISAWADECVDFPIVSPGEDLAWCRDMTGCGARIWRCSHQHFVYNRIGHDHAWRASDIVVRRALGESTYFGNIPDEWTDRGLVSGQRVSRPSDQEVLQDMAC